MAMGRDQVLPFLHASGRRFAAGLALWLALFAILLQVLMPLASARAEMTADGRFLPVCGLHDFDGDDGSSQGDQAPRQHCPLCQVQVFDRLIVPVRLAVPAFPSTIVQSAWPAVSRKVMPGKAAVPPLPSRGPPSVA